jgi:hypothetical protein
MINTLKYLVYTMSIYVLFSFIPKNKVCLLDLSLIITLIISFNLAYDLIENKTNPFIERYEDNPNEKIYSDALGIIKDDRNEYNAPSVNNQETISKNNPMKINPKLEEEQVNIVGSLGESPEVESLPTGFEEDTSPNVNLDINNEPEVIQALDTSNSSNLASLELTTEDNNIKVPIKIIKKEEVNKFKYGYSYMDTKFWDLPAKRKAVCKNVKPCKICPKQTSGFEKDRMKWN